MGAMVGLPFMHRKNLRDQSLIWTDDAKCYAESRTRNNATFSLQNALSDDVLWPTAIFFPFFQLIEAVKGSGGTRGRFHAHIQYMQTGQEKKHPHMHERSYHNAEHQQRHSKQDKQDGQMQTSR